MRQRDLYTKTRKSLPKDEVAKNAKLLIQGGFVNKELAGVYSYLPLGIRVLKKIEQIIREEMNAIDAQELLLSALHPKENWEKTGRWESMDDLYKVADESGRELALGPTHEEVVVPMVKQFLSSYKDLPFAVYQFQTKFRKELRAKSGILRGREFLMKDLYSFHADESDLDTYYERAKDSYGRIFTRAGIGAETYLTSASGGSFSKFSHEFQTVTEAGEDIIYLCGKCKVAVNKEIIKEQSVCPQCSNADLEQKKAVETGNIFKLNTKFSDPFGLTVRLLGGEERLVLMGCYGVGLGRLMGTIVEVLADEKGLAWPESVSPFTLHLLRITNQGSREKVSKYADELYEKLEKSAVDVLYDDREEVSAGEKFADADLIGIPLRAVVSEKTLTEGKVEIKGRKDAEARLVEERELVSLLKI